MSKKVDNKNTEKRITLSRVLKVTASFLAVVLILYFVLLVFDFQTFFDRLAMQNALSDVDNYGQSIDELIGKQYDKLYEIAKQLEFSKEKYEVDNVVSSYIGSEEFGLLRYFSNGTAYDAIGSIIPMGEENELFLLSQKQQIGCTPVYYDYTGNCDCVSFYVPVKGSEVVDGIASIIPIAELANMEEYIGEDAIIAAIVTNNGKIISAFQSELYESKVGSNIFNHLKNETENNEVYKDVYNLINNKDVGVISYNVRSTPYCFAQRNVTNTNGLYHFVKITERDLLVKDEYVYIMQIIVLSVVSVIFLLVSLITSHTSSREEKKEMVQKATMSSIGCSNIAKFKVDVTKIFSESSTQKYAIIDFEIDRYDNLASIFSEEELDTILKFIVSIFNRINEKIRTFGYSRKGRFVLLMKYIDKNDLNSFVQLANSLINKNEILVNSKTIIRTNIGVNVVEGKLVENVDEALDRAGIALEINKEKHDVAYTMFTEQIRRELAQNAEIETQMEEALRDHQFKVFVQPLYDVEHDCVGSGEALVRWFDTKTANYRFPGEFISLFETNGFITKLDHFMFEEVCKYFREAIDKGEKIVPLSVNASRVTSSQPDFINFCVSTKRKYEVPDNAITVEFTESFAMEDYNLISQITDELHKAGIKCSVDDFGSGYSSFNILKNVDLDVLKLDKFFIDKGKNSQRDQLLQGMVANMAKSLNMKVVQEGVETEEELERTKKVGVNFVQGYYYAKAIPLEEFRIFIRMNTSIKYKSLVK